MQVFISQYVELTAETGKNSWNNTITVLNYQKTIKHSEKDLLNKSAYTLAGSKLTEMNFKKNGNSLLLTTLNRKGKLIHLKFINTIAVRSAGVFQGMIKEVRFSDVGLLFQEFCNANGHNKEIYLQTEIYFEKNVSIMDVSDYDSLFVLSEEFEVIPDDDTDVSFWFKRM